MTAAVALVRLGTLTMLFFPWSYAVYKEPVIVKLFVVYGAVILAFIGGIQQATAVACDDEPLLVCAGIVLALGGFAAVAISELGGPALPVVCALYAVQSGLEHGHRSWLRLRMRTGDALMSRERSASMHVACLAYAATWWLERGDATKVCTLAAGVALLRTLVAIETPVASVVAVGSTNPCKVDAVRSALRGYGGAHVEAFAVASGVPEQPMGLDVTARGARQRAEAAFAHVSSEPNAIGLGVESGLFAIRGDDRLYDVCLVSAYDGHSHALGMSCAFEIPPALRAAVVDNNLDLSQAANEAKLVCDPDVGKRGGIIAILTKGRLTRKHYTIQAIQMALIPREHHAKYAARG